MSQYIGKTISLISVTDNRYVGLLQNIDSEKGTVTLNEVRCFGTEGRKNWGPDEVYPNPNVYQSVKFNGNDVKDLSILEVSLASVQPNMPPMVPPGVPLQPMQGAAPVTAPVNAPAGAPAGGAPVAVAQMPAAVAGYGVYAPDSNGNAPQKASEDSSNQPPVVDSLAASQPRSSNTFQSNEKPSKRPTKKQSQPNLSNSSDQPLNCSEHTKKPIYKKDFSSDFDFESNNAKFSKAEGDVEPKIAPTVQDDSADSFYDKKSSFFDNISTSAETSTNMRWQEEKMLNLDTFGQASVRPRFHAGRGGERGRGRGRGGRGRGGRGRGRGGRNDFESVDRQNNSNITF